MTILQTVLRLNVEEQVRESAHAHHVPQWTCALL